jgi:hypothetical protein
VIPEIVWCLRPLWVESGHSAGHKRHKGEPMRLFALIGGLLVLACAVVALGAFVWVDRALAAVQARGSGVLCLTMTERQKISAGEFPQDQRDVLVAKAINFDQGVPAKLWWHLRGAAIEAAYVTFWSRSQRDSEFEHLASNTRDCPTSQSHT